MKPRSIALIGTVSFLAACSGSSDRKGDTTQAATSSSSVDLTGAGATFPYPIYSKWFSDYATKTGVKINYQSIGSGGGIRQLSEGTVDFAQRQSGWRQQAALREFEGIAHCFSMAVAAGGATGLPASTPALAGPFSITFTSGFSHGPLTW